MPFKITDKITRTIFECMNGLNDNDICKETVYKFWHFKHKVMIFGIYKKSEEDTSMHEKGQLVQVISSELTNVWNNGEILVFLNSRTEKRTNNDIIDPSI